MEGEGGSDRERNLKDINETVKVGRRGEGRGNGG